MTLKEAMKAGSKVARSCWNGMWIEGGKLHFVHVTDTGSSNKTTAFIASQAELNADDWNVVE
jgi:hypothetical protein